MFHRIMDYIERHNNASGQKQKHLRPLDTEEAEFLYDVVAAGRAQIGRDMQVELAANEDMNSALLVLKHGGDPALFCWDAYSLNPELKAEYNLEIFRPYIEAVLKEEAKLSGRDLEKLSRTTFWNNMSKI